MKEVNKLPNLYNNTNSQTVNKPFADDPRKRLSIANAGVIGKLDNKVQKKNSFSNRDYDDTPTGRINNKHYTLIESKKSQIIGQIASKSRAGNSVGGARKTNQDSFLSLSNILGLEEFHIFAVFDGHGKISL